MLLECLCAHYVIERIVERPQIGIDFFLEVPGKIAQPLSRFHGGPGQYDPANLPILERIDGHSHGQVRFTGTRRADGEYDVILPHRFDIQPLAQSLALYLLSPCRHAYDVVEHVV